MTDFAVGGRVLDRYRVVRPLGSGGMGVVYLGRIEGAAGFTRPVVIKRLRAALASEREHNDMFVREARILSNLQHPNIVSVVDFGQEDGQYVMVLEYVHGYDLDQWSSFVWRKGRQHPVDHVLYIARRVLSALHYAHSLRRPDGTLANIVHRDVSLSNVLLDAQATVKLHDFGIARMEGGGEAPTETGVFKGKLGLAAPELIAGDRATPRSDIYALAVITYQLLSGINPFRGSDAANTMFRVLHHQPPPLAALRDDLPVGLDEVLSRGMHKEVDQRFEDAAQFADALGDLCSESDEDVTRAMAKRLGEDFASIPVGTELASLALRDAAWRDAQGLSDAPEPLSSTPPLIRSGPPPALRSTLPPARSLRASADPASARHFTSVSAARPRKLPSRLAERPWLLLAGVVGVLGAAAALFIARTPSQPATRYLVIEQPPGSSSSGLAASDPTAPAPTGPASALGAVPPAGAPPLAPDDPNGAAPREPRPALRPPASRPDANTLTREFRRHQPQVESCMHEYVEQIERTPQIAVRFEVNGAGKVTSAELSPAALTVTPLGACLLGVARSVQFSQLSRPVAFSIPITARRTP